MLLFRHVSSFYITSETYLGSELSWAAATAFVAMGDQCPHSFALKVSQMAKQHRQPTAPCCAGLVELLQRGLEADE